MTEPFGLLDKLGAGAFGTVWRALDHSSGEVVALKILHEHLASDPEVVQRFQREVEVLRRVHSPNVVKVYGYGSREGRPYVAMEYVPGGTLADLLRARGRLPWPEASRVVGQIATGLAAVHAAGVIHRDLKPSNVLLSLSGEAKIADFGVAGALDASHLTMTGQRIGTYSYMSPEPMATAPSDIYALGCIAFELVVGEPPFVGTGPHLLLRHVNEQPDLLRLPPETRDIVARMLNKSQSARPTAATVAAWTSGGFSGSEPQASAPAIAWPTAAIPPRSPRVRKSAPASDNRDVQSARSVEHLMFPRFAAAIIDQLIVAVLGIALLSALGLTWGAAELGTFTYFGIIPYGIGLEARNGQTIGKALLRLRVTTMEGGRPGAGAIVVRNLFRLVDGLLLWWLAGIVGLALSGGRRRFGDVVARTRVSWISERRPRRA